MAKKNINEFKDRMTAPVSFVRTDPKTRKPITTKKKRSK